MDKHIFKNMACSLTDGVCAGGGRSGPEEGDGLAGGDEGDHSVGPPPALQGGGRLQSEGETAGDGPERPVQPRQGQPAR